MSVQLFLVLLERDEYIQYLRDAWSRIDCFPCGLWFSFQHLHIPYSLCCALSLFHFVALGDMLAFLSVWAVEAQLLAFSSMFVHVCHTSCGFIQIVLWLRDRQFPCV